MVVSPTGSTEKGAAAIGRRSDRSAHIKSYPHSHIRIGMNFSLSFSCDVTCMIEWIDFSLSYCHTHTHTHTDHQSHSSCTSSSSSSSVLSPRFFFFFFELIMKRFACAVIEDDPRPDRKALSWSFLFHSNHLGARTIESQYISIVYTGYHPGDSRSTSRQLWNSENSSWTG